jgi:hypothetical protein
MQVEARKIRPGNFHKVPEILIDNLGIAKMTQPVSVTLGAPPPETVREVLVMTAGATAEMPGIGDCKNLNRLLKDTAHVVEKYNKMLKRQAEGGYVSCYTIVLSLSLFVMSLSLSLLSIYCCLPVFSDTT